jgi:hypothetical protein
MNGYFGAARLFWPLRMSEGPFVETIDWRWDGDRGRSQHDA